MSKIWQYTKQCAVASLLMLLVLVVFRLFTLSDVLSFVGLTTLASSIFILFALPDSRGAQPVVVLLSYLVALGVNLLLYMIFYYGAAQSSFISAEVFGYIGAAIAMGVSMFLLGILRLEHPPALGLSVGLFFEQWSLWSLLAIVGSIVLVVAVKMRLDKKLVPLNENE